MKKLLFAILLLCPTLAAQHPTSLPTEFGVTIIDDGVGGHYAVLDGGVVLPISLPDTGGHDTIESTWVSGGITRKVTTRYTGTGKANLRLAHKRHNAQVNDALEFWPVDP